MSESPGWSSQSHKPLLSAGEGMKFQSWELLYCSLRKPSASPPVRSAWIAVIFKGFWGLLISLIDVMSVASAKPVKTELKVSGSVSISNRAWATSAAVPLISVRAEPSMVPVPLAASRAEMSVASSAPAERVELKSAGVKKPMSVRAWSISAVEPLISVRANPSMVPVPLSASMVEMSVASAAPVRSESKLPGSESRSVMAWTTAAAVPSMSVRAEPSMVPLPLSVSMEVISVASAEPVRLESKWKGKYERSAVTAWTTAAAVPLMSVRAEPSMVPLPLAVLSEVISVASSAPAERVELKSAGVKKPMSARAWSISAAVPSMSVRAEPSMVPVPLAASRAVMSVASSAPAESVELKSVGSESRSARAWVISAVEPLISVRATPLMNPPPLAALMEEMSVASTAPLRSELKLGGRTSRSVMAWTTSAAVPLISVRAEPSISLWILSWWVISKAVGTWPPQPEPWTGAKPLKAMRCLSLSAFIDPVIDNDSLNTSVLPLYVFSFVCDVIPVVEL